MERFRSKALRALCCSAFLACFCPTAQAEGSCQTAAARISQVALQRLVDQHQADACRPLRVKVYGVTLAIDRTDGLKLKSFELCEEGPMVSIKGEFWFSCSTSDGAMVSAKISSDVALSRSVDFHSCAVEDVNIKVSDSNAQAALDYFKATDHAKDYLYTLIRPYCDH